MQASRESILPPPPGVIGSLRSGFDTIAAHIAAILLPICLDLLLWLGPRLGSQRFFAELEGSLSAVWRAAGVPTADAQAALEMYESTVPTVNFFSFLRTLPIGVSSLWSWSLGSVSTTPLGAVSTWQVPPQNLFAWILLLIGVGWAAGAVYYSWIARLCSSDPAGTRRRTGWALGQTVVLSIIWLGLALALILPAFLTISLLLQLNVILAQLAILALSFLSMWLVVPLFFSPHGVFVKQQPALLSIASSIKMARFTLPTSSFFVLSVFFLGVGLNFIWRAAPTDSWMTLVGILGHAFITTALLASSFIYYRDMTAWLDVALERLRAKTAVGKQA